YTVGDRCRQCYSCVRICPANSIKIEKSCVITIEARCILCGSCVKVCPQNARSYRSGLSQVLQFIESGQRTVACLDPSFPAILDRGTPRQLVAALRRLGFAEVWEVAFGAELVSRVYREVLQGQGQGPIISSFCPAVVSYVEKFAPQLITNLAPIVSPMIALGKIIRERHDSQARVVYVGSCLARIGEMQDPRVAGVIDQVLTFHEIRKLLDERGIDRESQTESEFDGPKPYMARMTAVSGGLLKSIGEDFDVLNDQISITSGRYRAVRAIQQIHNGRVAVKFLDVLFCEGCIDGPIRDVEISILGGRQIVARYTKGETANQDPQHTLREMDRFSSLDLHREFTLQDIKLSVPSEEEIQSVLRRINKTEPFDNLDCEACGYRTCREKAVAVLQGLAEIEMCLPYLLEQSREIYARLESSHKELQRAHQELEQAQQQLIRTEKLASIGQLAAGVAHEINNPLGTITIYSHMMMRELKEGDPRREDLQMIVDEVARAKEIVKGLLSFARETVLKPGMVNLNTVIEDVFGLIENQSLFFNIRLRKELDPSLPAMFVDAAQLKQVFLNIILNGAEAMEGAGELRVSTKLLPDGKTVEVTFVDTGPGIPEETLGKLFDPFFTTKEKGTGLGLAIAYGIVDRHGGSIDVHSQTGKGTTFTVVLPVMDEGDRRLMHTVSEKESPVLIGGV
ncbi:MAG: [Fe-Fe] hydrogenase large subunit C-terminal domain-containing protein, partial [bacterium]